MHPTILLFSPQAFLGSGSLDLLGFHGFHHLTTVHAATLFITTGKSAGGSKAAGSSSSSSKAAAAAAAGNSDASAGALVWAQGLGKGNGQTGRQVACMCAGLLGSMLCALLRCCDNAMRTNLGISLRERWVKRG
eukprot:scaffold16113_cov20-Tisochrysis_lutea.AAC.1